MPTKVKNKRVKLRGARSSRSVDLVAFEKELALETFVEIQLKGRQVGCAWLQKGSKKSRFVFGFECLAIHDNLKDAQVERIITPLRQGMKEMKGTATFHMESFSEDKSRQQYLDSIISQSKSPETQVILLSEKKRTQELTQDGIRQVKRLTIYVDITVSHDTAEATEGDWGEKAIAQVMALWQSTKKSTSGTDTNALKYKNLIESAFNSGYLRWEQLLSVRMGLEVRPLSKEELWQRLYQRFNKYEAPPIPQYVTCTDRGLTETVNSRLHPRSALVQGERGRSRIPISDHEWIKVKDKYIGVMAFTERPEAFSNVRHQLSYLWDVICRPQVRDIEIVTQVTSSSVKAMREKMQDVIKTSQRKADIATAQSSIDVGADIKLKKGLEAQYQLYEGAAPVTTATVFLVHRDRPSQLEDACNLISGCFPLPARLIRERDVAWIYWLQTLPIVWDRLLDKPYKRTVPYLTNAALGVIPLTMTRPLHSQGFELIADAGGTPINIDYIDQHQNIAMWGTTRAGKSIAVSGMLTLFLAHSYPVVALDYPKADGTSTFTDYADFLGDIAAYFDIGKESSNLMEIPDLRDLDPETRQERFNDYTSFLESSLLMLVQSTDQGINQMARAIMGKALKGFFEDDEIKARYERALDGGYKSSAWQQMPTLIDLEPFYSPAYLGFDEETSESLRNAREHIAVQLEYWINSKIGNAIAKPSSFPIDAQFLVFALRNVANDDEAAVLALSAYAAALRAAYSAPKSIFFIDESPILFEYDSIAKLIGRIAANGAKQGIRLFLSAQDPNTICESPAGSKIMQNMSVFLTGRIKETAIDSFVKYLRYDEKIISKNAGKSFFPQRSGLYSNWLVDAGGMLTHCRYYPSEVQLGIVANNMEEQAARSRVLKRFPGQRLRGYIEFSRQYAEAIRNGKSVEDIQ
ncbi:MAG: AAA-like domain [Phormidesmis priestleyi Ana]|uniref:AAA-like domain n=1 Tax=Phormidesmis priestleyi Ana TaxID=1666911 RepID=A0A0P7ZFG5_9CYAN|nr:MAG: AAA-like domain [Phormidesmis priestleyi Ana]